MQQEVLEQLLEPILAEAGCGLVAVEVRPHGHGVLLQVFLDRAGGIRVDDCALVSRRLQARLELNHPDLVYTLEVSSPGIDRKLRGARDAQLAVGRKVRVWTAQPVAGALEHGGTLTAADAAALTLAGADGASVVIPWSEVTVARLDPDLFGAAGAAKGRKR